jgi:NAD(P)H-dependent flavin oxidoreductase YrpB (nitropropane dioxygenase family)
LEETKRKLGSKPWGVGILGFVPKELREEQLAEVRRHPSPYAIIAGGRPDQAAALERDGIHTYLHIPSPALLKMFLESGTRRVIFEGRECGGHVGISMRQEIRPTTITFCSRAEFIMQRRRQWLRRWPLR